MSEHQAPPWSVPYPFGHAGAIDSMGAIAAPLLAGFSITFAGLVLTVPPHTVRWVNLTLALLMLAAFSLVACLQLTFRARQWVTSPSEIEQWFPDAQDEERQQVLRGEQKEHHQNYKLWSNRARYSYNFGILALVLAVFSAMVPSDPNQLGPLGGDRGRSDRFRS